MRYISDKFERQMGLTHREFFRTLPSAVGNHEYKIDGTTVDIALKGGTLRIELSAESQRQIASMRIAQTGVSFIFSGVSTDEKSSFIDYFEKRFQRGGG